MVMVQQMFTGINAFTLLALPFFFLAGNVMNDGGISERLVKLAMALVGHLRGGLAHVNVVVGMFISGISGSSTADAAAIGTIFCPAMKRRGYDERFAVCLTACTSTMGAVIPPSILMVDLRGDGRRVDRRAADRRHPARRADGAVADGPVAFLRAQVRFPARASAIPRPARRVGRREGRGLAARRAGDHRRRHGGRRVHADRIRLRRRRVRARSSRCSSSAACAGARCRSCSARRSSSSRRSCSACGAASIFGWLLAFYQVPGMVSDFILGLHARQARHHAADRVRQRGARHVHGRAAGDPDLRADHPSARRSKSASIRCTWASSSS